MNASLSSTSEPKLVERLRAIQALDLDPIKVKIMDREEGRGWTLEQANEAERRYKQFLVLKLRYPNRSIVPSKTVDQFWHQHILDTQKYAEDCQRIFGFFVHHFPYFGMRGEEDAANLKRCFIESQELLRKEFGEEMSIGATSAECDSSACDGQPSCGSSCTGATLVRSEERPRLHTNA